jgi:hypothetical protein
VGDESAGTAEGNPNLNSFRPRYVEGNHSLYVSLLAKDLAGTAPSQNIALSGAYGSGKSSVLAGLLKELDDKSVPAIQVSLATLNQSRASLLAVAGEPTLTAALEKEVVKRLLYSVKPKQIPRSRFNRIGAFRPGPAAGLSAVAGILAVGAATTFGVELPFTQLVEAKDWSPWTGFAADFLATGALAFAGQGALSSFRLSQIAVGPATLSLDDKNGNYFDHYLDEIVYFFERTETRVVLFEDLDRFDDPGIFLALRELNNLLNNSEQVSQPVSFVYAIRDSLFVEAVRVTGAHADEPDVMEADADVSDPRLAPTDGHAKYGAELAASDRAKFFDLIVPIVPFISHEVAADLLLETLRELPERLLPSRPLVAMAGRHFTDMRVIHSIRNEYEVFAAELLDKSAVKGLSQDQLFATVLFKHLHLDDFERIRTGESLLDSVVDKIRTWVGATVTKFDEAIASAEDAIESSLAIDRRAAAAGGRLLKRLDASFRLFSQGPAQSLSVPGSKAFTRDEVVKREFWEALAAAADQSLTVQSNHGGRVIAAADVTTFLERDSNPKAWLRSELQSDRQKLERLKEARMWVRAASFADLLGGPFPSAQLEAGHLWHELATECRALFDDELTFELIRGGYLDQNFAIYTTKFHGAILSAEARSYLMQYVDRHRNDPLFELSKYDVEEIVSRLGDTFLTDVSSLNVAVVDHLLETDAPKLPALLEATGQAGDFVATYLANGTSADALLRRITPARADILDIVVASASSSQAERRAHLNSCLAALSGDVAYTVSTTTAELLAPTVDTLPLLEEPLEPTVSAAVSDLFVANGLKVADLARVVEPLRADLAKNGCFKVTRANLQAITQHATAIGLDTLGGLDDGVGRHLLAELDQYLAAIGEEPAGSIVDEEENLDAVVRAVVANDPNDLAAALSALRQGVRYQDLAKAPEDAYRDLAAAGAFTPSRENVSQYVSVVGEIDSSLASQLEHGRSIVVSEAGEDDSEEEAARQALAAAVATSDHLSSEAKVDLIVSLKTHTTLTPADLALSDPALARGLLKAGEIADDAATFGALAAGPWQVFEACAAVSKALDGLIADLPFTDELLANVLLSPHVADAAKRSIVSNFDSHQPTFGEKSASAWMTASGRLGVALTSMQVTVLGQAGASAKQVLDFLIDERARLSAAEMVAILAFCEAPYSSLASANGATLTVPYSEALRDVLQTLKAANIVKDFRKKTLREQFDVHMVG